MPQGSTVATALAALKTAANGKVRAGMARYGLPSDKAIGVSVGTIQQIAKKLGRSQSLAEGLWKTDIYEARLLAAFSATFVIWRGNRPPKAMIAPGPSGR